MKLVILGLVTACSSPTRPLQRPTQPAPSITFRVDWDHRVSDEIEIMNRSTETTGAPEFLYSVDGLPAVSSDGTTIVFAQREQANGVEPSLHVIWWNIAKDTRRDESVQSMSEFQAAWRNRSAPQIATTDAAFDSLRATVEARVAKTNAALGSWRALTKCTGPDALEPHPYIGGEPMRGNIGPPKLPARQRLTCGDLNVTFEPYALRVESKGHIRFDGGVGAWAANKARAQGFTNIDFPTFYVDSRRGILVVRIEHVGDSAGESHGDDWHMVTLSP